LRCERGAVSGKYFSGVFQPKALSVPAMLELEQAITAGRGWQGELTFADERLWATSLVPLLNADGTCRCFMVTFEERRAATAPNFDVLPGGASRDSVPSATGDSVGALSEDLSENSGEDSADKRSENAAQNEQLIRMGKLAGTVIHEIKNILQNVSSILQIMQFKYMHDDGVQTHIKIMLEQLGTADNMLMSFLGLSRTDLNVAEYSLNDVLRETMLLMYGSCHVNGVEVEESLCDNMRLICIDKNRIKQVIVNCLENSVDAICERRREQTDLKGKIKITTSCDAAAEMAYLTLEDNGSGLTGEQLANFFKPFYTTKENGTGMGTAISATIVRMHGGNMEAWGEPGVGCKVRISLPFRTALLANHRDMYAEYAKLGG
jgi:two-component system sporulation sensor kinase B